MLNRMHRDKQTERTWRYKYTQKHNKHNGTHIKWSYTHKQFYSMDATNTRTEHTRSGHAGGVLAAELKVGQHHMRAVAQQNVGGLEVQVRHPACMNVRHRRHHLQQHHLQLPAGNVHVSDKINEKQMMTKYEGGK